MRQEGLLTEKGRAAGEPHRKDGDELESKFHLVTLTAQRAKQLQNGARPRVDGGDHRHLRVAMLEVMAGLISWSVLESPEPRKLGQEK